MTGVVVDQPQSRRDFVAVGPSRRIHSAHPLISAAPATSYRAEENPLPDSPTYLFSLAKMARPN